MSPFIRSKINAIPINDLSNYPDQNVTLIGIISVMNRESSECDSGVNSIVIQDNTGSVEGFIRTDHSPQHNSFLKEGAAVILKGLVQTNPLQDRLDKEVKIFVEEINPWR